MVWFYSQLLLYTKIYCLKNTLFNLSFFLSWLLKFNHFKFGVGGIHSLLHISKTFLRESYYKKRNYVKIVWIILFWHCFDIIDILWCFELYFYFSFTFFSWNSAQTFHFVYVLYVWNFVTVLFFLLFRESAFNPIGKSDLLRFKN